MNINHRAKGSVAASEGTKSPPVAGSPAQIQRLLDVMASLRAPEGCPWDRAQTFESLVPYLQEESAEYIDALRAGDAAAMLEELGDVLLQIVFHAQIAEEAEMFSFQDVVDGIAEKLWSRHPHVFGDHARAENPAEVEQVWEAQKAKERVARGEDAAPRSPLDRVPRSMEPLTRAHELGRRAAKVGFDWATADDVIPKIHEELAELQQARDLHDADGVEEELGDLLCAVVTLARKLGVRPDAALARTNRKFEERFAYVAARMNEEGLALSAEQMEAMSRHWDDAREKRVERG